MSTIFGIATNAEKLNAVLSSLIANAISLEHITVIMPHDPEGSVPLEAGGAHAVADDFSGNPKRALVGGAIGTLVGMGVLALSILPGVFAFGAGAAALGAAISGGAGGSLGALLGLGLADAKVEHYEARLKSGARLIIAKVPDARAEDFVGLFEREGLEDIAVGDDAAVASTH